MSTYVAFILSGLHQPPKKNNRRRTHRPSSRPLRHSRVQGQNDVVAEGEKQVVDVKHKINTPIQADVSSIQPQNANLNTATTHTHTQTLSCSKKSEQHKDLRSVKAGDPEPLPAMSP